MACPCTTIDAAAKRNQGRFRTEEVPPPDPNTSPLESLETSSPSQTRVSDQHAHRIVRTGGKGTLGARLECLTSYHISRRKTIPKPRIPHTWAVRRQARFDCFQRSFREGRIVEIGGRDGAEKQWHIPSPQNDRARHASLPLKKKKKKRTKTERWGPTFSRAQGGGEDGARPRTRALPLP